MSAPHRIIYCNCTYAQVVPREVKAKVLKSLCESDAAFDAVADLCEMSARRDPALQRLAAGDGIKIAACYPRAVKWLFDAAHAPLAPEKTEILNMRVETAEAVCESLFNGELKPNLPQKSSAVSPAATSAEIQS